LSAANISAPKNRQRRANEPGPARRIAFQDILELERNHYQKPGVQRHQHMPKLQQAVPVRALDQFLRPEQAWGEQTRMNRKGKDKHQRKDNES
jgi:hypothetical protein